MPYGTVNLRDGVPEGETPITCTAGVGTYIIEFGTLSRLTGDPVFEQVRKHSLIIILYCSYTLEFITFTGYATIILYVIKERHKFL